MSTAPSAALESDEIRIALAESVSRLDGRLETLIRAAQARGEIAKSADPAALAMLGTATLHTIAIRARAGDDPDHLEKMAKMAVAAICSVAGGSAGAPGAAASPTADQGLR